MELLLESLTMEQILLFILGSLLFLSSLYFAFKNYKAVFIIYVVSFFLLTIVASVGPENLLNITISQSKDGNFSFSLTTKEYKQKATKLVNSNLDFILADSNVSDGKSIYKLSTLNNNYLYKEAINRGTKERSSIDFLVISTKEFKDKNYEEALRQAYNGIRISKDNKIKSLLEMMIGSVFRSLELYDMAKEQIEIAISLDEKNINAYNILGLLYRKTGGLEKAEQIFLKAKALDENYIYAYYNLGILYNKQKRYTEAVDMFDKVINIDPKFKKVKSRLKNSYKNLIKEYDLNNKPKKVKEIEDKLKEFKSR